MTVTTKTLVRSAALAGAALLAFTASTSASATAGPGKHHLTDITWQDQGYVNSVDFTFRNNSPAFDMAVRKDAAYCGSGKPVDFRAEQYIVLDVDASAHDENGEATFTGDWAKNLHMPYITGYAITCDWEDNFQIVVGVRGNQALGAAPTDTGIQVDVFSNAYRYTATE